VTAYVRDNTHLNTSDAYSAEVINVLFTTILLNIVFQ